MIFYDFCNDFTNSGSSLYNSKLAAQCFRITHRTDEFTIAICNIGHVVIKLLLPIVAVVTLVVKPLSNAKGKRILRPIKSKVFERLGYE